MDHTNDKTLVDERVQSSSREASRVVTPTVTGNTECEESDRGQRQSIHQSNPIPTTDGQGQKLSKKLVRQDREGRRRAVCVSRGGRTSTNKIPFVNLYDPRVHGGRSVARSA